MNTFWVHKNWKWKKENATARYIDEHCEEAVTLADAQATVEALQRERDEAIREHGKESGFWGRTCARLLDKRDKLQTALDAEREKVKGLHEVTKVICTHCCEPMEIPSKAVLQTQLTQLQALVRALLGTWVNGRKIHDGIPMTLRQQIDATLDATTPAQHRSRRGSDGLHGSRSIMGGM